MLSKVDVAHFPPNLSVYIALFTEIENAAYLRKQLLDGNTAFEFAFLDARCVLSTTHVLAAVFRAVNDMTNNRMKSRNVHSEIVFAFSPNNNVAEAYRKFGIADDTRNLIVVKISNSGTEDFQKVVQEGVKGRVLDFNDENLAGMSDVATIRKTYKLQQTATKKAAQITPNGLVVRNELVISVLGLMALRGAS